MKKKFRYVLVVLVVALVAAVVFAQFFLGATIKTAVNRMGPKFTRTAVTLQDVKFSLVTGTLQITGLVVGNPKGYRTPDAMRLGRFYLKLKPLSLLSRVVVIEKIHIDAPEITYEMGAGDSNLARIEKNLAGERQPETGRPNTGPEPRTEPAPPAKKEKAARKVQINDLLLEHGKVYVSATMLHGARATIPLPPIHITDIGKDTGGATVAESIALVLESVMETVAGTARSAGTASAEASEVGSVIKGLLKGKSADPK